ncbi:MAG: hypothetical protein ABI561_01330 [Bradyrhizobium sp.]
MIKSLTAFAIFALLATSVIALPGFAPQVKADEVKADEVKAAEAIVLAKADRLPIHAGADSCASQIWPNIVSTCLRNAESGAPIREARLVTARR